MNTRLVLAAVVSAAALLGGAGCAVTDGQQSVGAYAGDAATTAKVKAKFVQSELVGAEAITVETLNGEVQLAGFAKSEAEREQAGKLARETTGVKAVRNDIVVR
jgi:hyperosmotically inducible periplasmic protein